jgi:hypothetical protein
VSIFDSFFKTQDPDQIVARAHQKYLRRSQVSDQQKQQANQRLEVLLQDLRGEYQELTDSLNSSDYSDLD